MTDAVASPPGQGLVLAPPAPVAVVEPEAAAGSVPVDAAAQEQIRSTAVAFVQELMAIDHRSPDFADKVSAVTSMGDTEMRAAAAVSNRMLERPAAALGSKGGDAQTRVAGTLSDLRRTVTDLDPHRADLTGARKLLKWVPGGNRIDSYFQRYASAQSQLNDIIRALESGQDDLRKDNAAIETEKVTMWEVMGKLAEYEQLARALDAQIEEAVAREEAAGRTETATALRSDALFPVRQRREDLMVQMAVNVQGYLALDLVRRNNIELIKGVDRAQTTTVSALRTAVIVSQALARQKLVLDQITALNTVTSSLIESTSQQLRQQGTAINQQAAQSTVDVQKLQAAFDNVFATMDAIDTFRGQATESMAQTVTALEGQIQRARPYLDRVRATEQSG